MPIATEQRIISPGHTVKTLLAHHLPLGAFERKTDARIPGIRVDTHLV